MMTSSPSAPLSANDQQCPRGSAAGYMPELNVLIGAKDYSAQSDQPLMKSIRVRVTPTAVSDRV